MLFRLQLGQSTRFDFACGIVQKSLLPQYGHSFSFKREFSRDHRNLLRNS
jgi:hypothetical protein